jgi:porin
MNDVFVNSPLANLPSYDGGAALELEAGNWSVRGVVMNSKNDLGHSYNYYGAQLGYAAKFTLGEGNYRVYGYATDDVFEGSTGSEEEHLTGLGLSLDQKFGETFGVFARLATQDDDALVDHDRLYSAGLNINGSAWGREKDEIGIGYARLDGAEDSGIDQTTAVEGYVKLHLSAYSDLTFDIQHVEDNLEGEDADPSALIYGVRLNAYF